MRRFDQINVIPFIDIMLVLLAIVLTTASFIATGKLDISVPEADSKVLPPADPPVELAIDRDEKIYFNQQQVTLDTLRPELAKLTTETSVVLRIDESVVFGRFVAVMDILKTHQLENLSIITRQKP